MRNLSTMFENWVREQPRHETFDPWGCDACAGFQFLSSLGFPIEAYNIGEWEDYAGVEHEVPAAMGDAVDWALKVTPPHTGRCSFGALADFLDKSAVLDLAPFVERQVTFNGSDITVYVSQTINYDASRY